MKHNLRVCVSREPKAGGIVSCRTVPVRERLMTWLFGSKQMVTVLIPGNSVSTVSITEVPEEGLVYE